MASKEILGTATIANGQMVSTTIDLRGSEAWGIVMPDAFTGTELTFQTSSGDSDYQTLCDTDGVPVQVGDAAGGTPVLASRNYDIPGELNAWAAMKIVSNAAEGGARSIIVVGRGLEQ